MTMFFHPTKIKRTLFSYWFIVSLLFCLYISVLATVKNISAVSIFTSIPSLALASIVVFLLIFQLFGLFIVGDSSDYRHSLLGFYLKFNMVQQLFSLNIPGLLLCVFYYRSLAKGKEESKLSKQTRWMLYALMGFIGVITILVVFIRLSL